MKGPMVRQWMADWWCVLFSVKVALLMVPYATRDLQFQDNATMESCWRDLCVWCMIVGPEETYP